MASESQADIQRLSHTSDNSTPTSAVHTTSCQSYDRGTEANSPQGPEKNGWKGGHGLDYSTSESRPADRLWVPHGEDVNHSSTPPIDVPQHSSTTGNEWLADKNVAADSLYQDLLPLEEYMRNRQTSISFHPKVTLESGHQRALDEALPKLAINTDPSTTLGRHSMIHEARRPLKSSLSEVHSTLDCSNSHTETDNSSQDLHSSDPQTYSSQSPEAQRNSTESEQGVSLTSESSASPVISEIQTPTDNMEILMSPVSAFPPFAYPTSLEDSSAWPKPRRAGSGARAKSYNMDRGSSMRSAQRQNTRSLSRRSTSTSMSPATAFLSRFASKEETPPAPDSEGQEVGEYVLGKEVGFGGFSTVREAYTLEGDERICRAVKVVRKQIPGKEESENEQLQAEFEHEVSLWRCLAHRNILPLIEVYDTSYATFCFTKFNTGGTLFDLVRANRHGLSRDLSRRYAYQLASALRYLHEDVHVVHRDIKLENCLIDVSDPDSARDGGNVLLCDFGLAEFVTNDMVRGSPDPFERPADRPAPREIDVAEGNSSIAGSLQYASPELIMSPAGFLSSVVDVWAFGVVIYALLVGDLPFQHIFQPRVQMMILGGEWNTETLEKAEGSAGYEEEILELMRGCLEMQSESRWTIANVLGCRWLKGCQEMLEEHNDGFRL